MGMGVVREQNHHKYSLLIFCFKCAKLKSEKKKLRKVTKKKISKRYILIIALKCFWKKNS